MVIRPIGEGFEYRARKSTIANFISFSKSNAAAARDGHPETSTVLSFRMIPLNSALVHCPVSFA